LRIFPKSRPVRVAKTDAATSEKGTFIFFIFHKFRGSTIFAFPNEKEECPLFQFSLEMTPITILELDNEEIQNYSDSGGTHFGSIPHGRC